MRGEVEDMRGMKRLVERPSKRMRVSLQNFKRPAILMVKLLTMILLFILPFLEVGILNVSWVWEEGTWLLNAQMG